VDFWNRFDEIAERWNVLDHPFYERWSRGELLRDELARYSGQYRHAVVALADASSTAAGGADGELRDHLSGHAAEEAGHVELWDRFAEAVGGDAGAAPNPESEICAATWAGEGRSAAETLAALYAIESAQPAIAETKRQGLVEHYGLEPNSAGTEYFDVHATLDHDHAAAHRALLEPEIGNGRDEELLEAARAALAANWALLDGVDRGGG
jgi:pyrroloquinoline-quinone synthase